MNEASRGPAPGSPVPAPGSPVPASAVQRLTLIAGRAAEANGEADPAWVSVVVTTNEKALTSATPGDRVPGREQMIVYLVTMEGQFVSRRGGRRGAKAPAGKYLSVVLNAETFEITDVGLSPNPPPVAPASLGPVTCLKT